MATSKQPKDPAFPHPPLEVGVAQYPTPLVPNYNDKKGGWSISDQGHIILVEKISIEKGNFTPLPLDGTITYTGRDANKWPSTLYLVAERPTPDGMFCYRYWANDRSLSSQDLWNYGLDYSANNPAYPITSRTYIVPRDQYEVVPLATLDPVFGGNQIISQQKMVELPEDNPLASRYVAVQRVYETIPGPVITGKRLDQRGDLETINVQTVAAGTAPDADGLLITETKVDPVDSVKSTKTTASVDSYATLFAKQNKSGLLGITQTTDDIVDPSTQPDALSTTILDSSVEQVSKTKARKRTTSSSGPTQLNGKSLQEFGIAETLEKIVSYGSYPPVSQNTIKAEVSPIDGSKSKLTEVFYSSPSSISGYQYDEFFQRNLTISKQIVIAGSSPISLSNGILSYKDEPINPYQSQRIIVSTDGLPPTRIEYKTASYVTPQLVFGLAVDYVKLSVSTTDVRITITPITRAAQSRLTMQRITTSYSYGSPSAPDPSTILSPELKRVAFTGYNINFDLGDALCDNLYSYGSYVSPTLANVNSAMLAGYLDGNILTPWAEQLKIDATTISATTYNGYLNTWKTTSYEQEYWKAGIWVARKIETYII
jgi:hypothetical protein